MKGDFDETSEEWVFNTKRQVACAWTGMGAEDLAFFLNGFTFVSCVQSIGAFWG